MKRSVGTVCLYFRFWKIFVCGRSQKRTDNRDRRIAVEQCEIFFDMTCGKRAAGGCCSVFGKNDPETIGELPDRSEKKKIFSSVWIKAAAKFGIIFPMKFFERVKDSVGRIERCQEIWMVFLYFINFSFLVFYRGKKKTAPFIRKQFYRDSFVSERNPCLDRSKTEDLFKKTFGLFFLKINAFRGKLKNAEIFVFKRDEQSCSV